MYTNLIQEDILTLDNEFFKIDTMFETVNKMYDIKMKELEYNYIYTESINEEYIDLYTEAEVAKDRKEQGLLGRLFTAILNFIRSIRAKILRLFGNDKKAAELEAKIKGNPKLANQIVEITNTSDAEKAVDEGVGFFSSLIDKVVKGTAIEKDANEAEEKGKTLLGRIGIFGGVTLLAAGGVKVANNELKKRDKLTIQESLRNLFKKEQAIKKKAENVTKETEEIVKKGEDALKNNSQNSNEENTKAGRGILGSFKNFITGASSLFTGTISEIRSRFSSSTNNNEIKDETKPNDKTEEQKEQPKASMTEQKNDKVEQDSQNNKQQTLRQEENEPQPKKNDEKKENSKQSQENTSKTSNTTGIITVQEMFDKVKSLREAIDGKNVFYTTFNFATKTLRYSEENEAPFLVNKKDNTVYVNKTNGFPERLITSEVYIIHTKSIHDKNSKVKLAKFNKDSLVITSKGEFFEGASESTKNESSYDLINDILTIFENSFK